MNKIGFLFHKIKPILSVKKAFTIKAFAESQDPKFAVKLNSYIIIIQ